MKRQLQTGNQDCCMRLLQRHRWSSHHKQFPRHRCSRLPDVQHAHYRQPVSPSLAHLHQIPHTKNFSRWVDRPHNATEHGFYRALQVSARQNNKKLSCRSETAGCFVSLNISLSLSSLKFTQDHSKWHSWEGRKSLLVFRSNCTRVLSVSRTFLWYSGLNNSVTLKFGFGVVQDHWKCTIRKLGHGFLFVFRSNYSSMLYYFGDNTRYWSKVAMFSYLHCTRRPR